MSERKQRPASIVPEANTIGKGEQGAAARSKVDTQNYMDGMTRIMYLIGYIIGFFGTCGVVVGIFIRQILVYLAESKLEVGDRKVPAGAGMAGVVLVVVSVGGALVLLSMMMYLRHRVATALEEIAQMSGSEAEMQKIFAQNVISHLNSPKGEKWKLRLQDAGVNPEDVEGVLTSAPEEMHLKLIGFLSAQVQARIACKLFEDSMAGVYAQYEQQIILAFLGLPGYFDLLIFVLAGFCIEFKPQPAMMGIGSTFVLCSVLFLIMLSWHKAFAASLAAGLACSMVGVCATWGITAFNVISLILWLMGVNMFVVFLVLCAFWFCYGGPLMKAAYDYVIEAFCVQIWNSFGLNKNDGVLERKEADLWHKAGFLKHIVRRLAGSSNVPLTE